MCPRVILLRGVWSAALWNHLTQRDVSTLLCQLSNWPLHCARLTRKRDLSERRGAHNSQLSPKIRCPIPGPSASVRPSSVPWECIPPSSSINRCLCLMNQEMLCWRAAWNMPPNHSSASLIRRRALVVKMEVNFRRRRRLSGGVKILRNNSRRHCS